MRAAPGILSTAMLCLAGCASLVSGTSEEVNFRSTPEGAAIIVDGSVVGKTPASIMLKKGEHHVVAFEAPNYQRLTLPMSNRLDGWFWGNILIGGVFGSTTDGVSGAAYKYSPNQFLVTLTPSRAAALQRATSVGPAGRARQFIVAGYAPILRDLAVGKGEYADSLLKVLNVPDTDKPSAVTRLAALSVAYPDMVDFADKAIELYLKDDSSVPEQGASPEPVAEQFHSLCMAERAAAEASIRKLKPEQRTALTDYIFRTKGSTSPTEETFEPFLDMPDEEKRCIDWYVKTFTDYGPAAK